MSLAIRYKIYNLESWSVDRTARAARASMQSFDLVYQTTTWNIHIWCLDNNATHKRKSSTLCFSVWKLLIQIKWKDTSRISYNLTNTAMTQTLRAVQPNLQISRTRLNGRDK